VLLADEPTGALDSAGGAEVMELFRRLHKDGQTILLVTHDDDVASAADRIVEMRDGRIVDGQATEGGEAHRQSVFGPLLGAPREVEPTP
jgi:putative ABC transport system ATP-binding protein